jgi:hypothetical protein
MSAPCSNCRTCSANLPFLGTPNNNLSSMSANSMFELIQLFLGGVSQLSVLASHALEKLRHHSLLLIQILVSRSQHSSHYEQWSIEKKHVVSQPSPPLHSTQPLLRPHHPPPPHPPHPHPHLLLDLIVC